MMLPWKTERGREGKKSRNEKEKRWNLREKRRGEEEEKGRCECAGVELEQRLY